MKILLVLPAADHLRVKSPGGRPPKRAMLRFSLLPLTVVAALTPPQHQVSICDENVEAIDWDCDADVVGVTFMTALAPRAYQIAAAFRARGKIVVAGGYHPTLCCDEAAEHFDAVVVGEAEGNWQQLLADIEAGKLQRVYRLPQAADVTTTPVPRRDLTDRTARHYVTTNAVQTGAVVRMDAATAPSPRFIAAVIAIGLWKTYWKKFAGSPRGTSCLWTTTLSPTRIMRGSFSKAWSRSVNAGSASAR